MRRPFGVVAVLCFQLLAGAAAAATINVPGDFAQIHDAVQAAQAGDVVLVAPGTYADCTHETEGPGSTPACVIMKEGVILRGSGQAATIIDAQGLGRGVFVEGLETGAVEDLQVRNSYAPNYGSGILVRTTGPDFTISDVTVQDCGDGGVILINQAHATLRRLTIQDNVAKQGGGLSIEENSRPRVEDCQILRNQAPSGAGVFIRAGSDAFLRGCVIDANVIDSPFGQGGGIFIGESSPTILRCDITNNVGRGNGGGVAYQLGSGGRMEACVIAANTVTDAFVNGAGLAVDSSDPVIEGCLIADNVLTGSGSDGAGVFCIFSPSPTLIHCTIDGNATAAGGEGGGVMVFFGAAPVLERCIVSNSTAGKGLFCNGGSMTVSCSDVFGNAGGDDLCGTDAGGNISADPAFCGPDDYALGAGSACLDVCGGAIGAYPFGCTATDVGAPRAAARLLGNHPNPFNPSTTISFELDAPGAASVRIVNAAGDVVATLTLGDLPAGRHAAVWNGRDDAGRPAASGVYLYELEALGSRQTRQMILIK